ncbi:nitrous oxide-stimulated promoter family protein [Candidatus Latescibacterota bacterium]
MDKAKEKQFEILKTFIGTYCKHHHNPEKDTLCSECTELQDYARERIERCPYDPKPKCKDCNTHCYKPVYRKKITEIMRFSGMHFVKRGRLDWLLKYFLS